MTIPFDREYILDLILTFAVDQVVSKKIHYTRVKPRDIDASAKLLVAGDPSLVTEYLLMLIRQVDAYMYGGATPNETNMNEIKQHLRQVLLRAALSKKVQFNERQLLDILNAFCALRPRYDATILAWPLEPLLKRIQDRIFYRAITSEFRRSLLDLKRIVANLNSRQRSVEKLLLTMDTFLNQ